MKLRETLLMYHEHFENDRLPYLRCVGCGVTYYYPRSFCSSCKKGKFELLVSRGAGKVYSLTRSTHAGKEMTYAIVELSEGFRMYSTIVEDERIDIGAMVKVEFEKSDRGKIPVYRSSNEH